MKRNVKSQRRLARLTPLEDKQWVFAFSYHLERRRGERLADQLAWSDLRAEFPRLRRYDGCRP